MQMIGHLLQSFGPIHGFRTLIQPATSLLFHIPAGSLIQHEEEVTTPNKLRLKLKQRVPGMERLHQTLSIAQILGVATLQVTGRMHLPGHLEVVHVQEGAMTQGAPLPRIHRLSTTT